jgi:hypothetical protein
MIEIFNNSRINLNFTGPSKIFEKKIESKLRQIKGHCQEVALTRSFVLTENSAIIHRLFKIGSEVDTFYDENELLEKINFYLKHNEKRKQMADQAYQRALRDYDIFRVWKTILQLIYYKEKNKKYRNADIIVEGNFLKAVCLGRVKYILYFMGCCKFRLMWEEISAGIKSGSIFLIPVVIIEQIVIILRKLHRRFKKIFCLNKRHQKFIFKN